VLVVREEFVAAVELQSAGGRPIGTSQGLGRWSGLQYGITARGDLEAEAVSRGIGIRSEYHSHPGGLHQNIVGLWPAAEAGDF